MSTPFSILELGRRINRLNVAYNELDDTRPEERDSILRDRHETRMSMLNGEALLLQDLVVALRPQTLSGPAVQLAILFYNTDRQLDSDDVDKLHEGIAKVQRSLAGAIRTVAAAAGVDLSPFAPPDLTRLMDAHCPEPEDSTSADESTEQGPVKW